MNAKNPTDLFEDGIEHLVNQISVTTDNITAITINEVNNQSKTDTQILMIKKCLDNDKLWDSEKSIQAYKPFKTEYCFHENILLRSTKIVMPTALRNKILTLSHEGHPGTDNMKRLLRSYAWWPKIDADVIEYVKQCHECALVTVTNISEPLKMRSFPTTPWAEIAIDFCGPMPNNIYLLVIIDYYSRFKEVIPMEKITSKDTIEQLRKLFSLLGLPRTITADNGRQFVSHEFKCFCKEHGIILYTTPPYWPQANGLVERQNNSILKRLRISANTPGSDWQKDLQSYLLIDRNTPHPATGVSPAQLLFGRATRIKIPSISEQIIQYPDHSEVRDKDTSFKSKTKEYADKRRRAKTSNINEGDTVLVKSERKENKLSAPYKNELYTVIRKHQGDVILTSNSTGKTIRRHIAHLKLYSPKLELPQLTPSSSEEDVQDEKTPPQDLSPSDAAPKLRIKLGPNPSCTLLDQ